MSESNDMAGASFLTLQESAGVIGGFCWVERRLFEVLGSWVGVEERHEAKLLFAAHSRRHGWHSELWTERLPTARGLDVADLVVPPSAGAAAQFDALESIVEPAATVARLSAIFGGILPDLLASYRAHAAAISVVAEGPAIRAISLILTDDERDLAEGIALLERMESRDPG